MTKFVLIAFTALLITPVQFPNWNYQQQDQQQQLYDIQRSQRQMQQQMEEERQRRVSDCLQSTPFRACF